MSKLEKRLPTRNKDVISVQENRERLKRKIFNTDTK